MAIKFEKIQAGMTLYDRHRRKMGNTTMRTIGEWPVRVVEIDPVERRALISWNGNPPHWQNERALRGLFDWTMRNKDEAEVVRGLWDAVVKVTRRKPCPKCRARHASEQCASKETP
jgi:hypothetical protein